MTTERRPATSWLAAPLLLLLATSCCTGDADPTAADAQAAEQPRAEDTSKVLQTMDAGGYTYIELDVGGEATWFAGPVTAVAKGDTVVTPPRNLPMRDFRSDTLDRTFDVIYFVDAIRKTGDASTEQAVQQAHGAGTGAAPAEVDLTGIPKADGGMTVEEVFALGKDGAGQDIVLRGKVVKFNANILGKNWLHVRDGTGAEGENDIVVTSADSAKVGDTVVVRGKLAADRDLGHGYKFDLLIEDAAVTVE